MLGSYGWAMEPTESDSTCDVPMPQAAPATDGAFELRVRYCECDPMGVAHHASFAPWLEIARTELLRSSGVSYAQLESAGVFLVVAKLAISYRRPAKYDDVLRIVVRVERAGRVKLVHGYEVRLIERGDGDDSKADLAKLTRMGDDLLATAQTTLACVDGAGQPTMLPAWLAGA